MRDFMSSCILNTACSVFGIMTQLYIEKRPHASRMNCNTEIWPLDGDFFFYMRRNNSHTLYFLHFSATFQTNNLFTTIKNEKKRQAFILDSSVRPRVTSLLLSFSWGKRSHSASEKVRPDTWAAAAASAGTVFAYSAAGPECSWETF